jgi:predicted Zn finger-like uncharacterized protein
MKLACHTCQARYSIADDKIRGKIVKIRCKKCGAIVVASAPADVESGVSRASRTGERGEQSVLFSLSALHEARSPIVETVAPSDASGLIDIRMLAQAMARPVPRLDSSASIAHLGGGGVFAPQALLGESEPTSRAVDPGRPTPARRGKTVLVAMGTLGLVVLATPGVGLLKRAFPSPLPPMPARRTSVVGLLPTSVPDTASVTTNVSQGDAGSMLEPTALPMMTAGPAPTPKPTVVMGTPPKPFDPASVARALGAVDVRGCANAGGPTGTGHARVTLQPNGAVSDVVVDTPELAGTPTERCVAGAYRRLKVAPFAGPALTVGKRFIVPDE